MINERIKELIKQCTSWSDGSTWTSREVFDKEKFAELIVRECYEWAKKNGGLGAEYDYDALKEHFGVKEPQGWVCPKCGTDRTQSACPRGHTAAITGDCPMYGVAQ